MEIDETAVLTAKVITNNTVHHIEIVDVKESEETSSIYTGNSGLIHEDAVVVDNVYTPLIVDTPVFVNTPDFVDTPVIGIDLCFCNTSNHKCNVCLQPACNLH